MIKAKVQSGNLRMATFYKAVLDQADFRDARLYRAGLLAPGEPAPSLRRRTSARSTPTETNSIRHNSMRRPWNRPISLQRTLAVRTSPRESHHADLQEAEPPRRHVIRGRLTGARLDTADLQRATLHGANLSLVSGLTQAQLDTACVDEQTKLPAELSRPAPCAAAKTKR